MRIARAVLVAAALPAALPASAREALVDVPPGSVAESAVAVARQTRSTIVISDPLVAARRAPAIRGRMGPREAVRLLARAAGASAVTTGHASWRIVRAAPPRPERSPARRVISGIAVDASQAEPPVEIVVVASKREARMSEMPAQLSILAAGDVTMGGVGGTERITQRLASVSSTHLGSGRNKLFIRGIADSSFTGPTQSTVGQYLGDLRLTYSAPDPDLRLSDIERIEVLEGPQGTLYGAGSLGGIIRIIPRPPALDEISGSATIGGSVTRSGSASSDLGAVLNLPLQRDRAALRVVVDVADQGGYIDKPALGGRDVNRVRILSGRGSVRMVPAPGWSIDLIALAQSTDAADSQYADRDEPDYHSLARVREGGFSDYRHAQLVVSGQLGAARFRSTSGIVGHELEERYDASQPQGPDRIFVQRSETALLLHETRAWSPLEPGRLGWLAGVSLLDSRTSLARSLDDPGGRSPATGVRNAATEATLFGEASLHIGPGLIGTLGARLTGARLGGAAQGVPLALAAERGEVTASRPQSAFLPAVSLVARLSAETSLYVRYQEGFRPGGLAIEGDFVRRFEEDRAAAFEVGVRHGRPDRDPFTFELGVSHTRWDNIQADYVDTLGLPTTANIGDGRVWALSATAAATVAAGLRISGGLTLNHSRVEEGAFLALGRTDHIPNIAAFSGRIGADYETPLAGSLTIQARGWASYVGRSRLGVGPELGNPQGEYLDTGLVLRIGDRGLGATLSANNLANVAGNRFALGTPFGQGRDQVTPLRPRTVRLGLDLAF